MTVKVEKTRKYLWGILYGLALTIFTVYLLLDTFVIARVYQVVPRENGPSVTESENKNEEDNGTEKDGENNAETEEKSENEERDGTTAENGEAKITENSYEDDNISITVTEYRENGTTVYVADVRLSSAEYLKTAFANGAYGKNVTEKTSEIAKNNGAILAINGDYYGSRENGFVLRNGTLYRNSAANDREALVVYEDGSFETITETAVSAESLAAAGAEQIFAFGPSLVVDGEISITEDEEVGKAQASNPRTAIGIVGKLHYLFVVSDGRTDESEGLSLYELAEFMRSLGAVTAYNLDGGGSSTMYFNGKIINNPTTNGRTISERSVSDIVYIGY